MKAYTSSSVPYSTRALAEMAADPRFRALADIPGLLLLAGGEPIFSENGSHIGGIGVGGGSGAQDELCAKKALESLSSL